MSKFFIRLPHRVFAGAAPRWHAPGNGASAMLTKTKLLLSLLILVLTGTAHAAFYADLRLSHLTVQGTPEIGDIGVETGSDLPELSATIALGYELSKRANLELRYTHLGDLTVDKISPYPTVFPLKPGEVVPFVTSTYGFKQRTSLLAVALPFQLWGQDKFSLHLTPLLQCERADVELLAGSLPALPNANTVPVGTVFYRRSTTELHAGIELDLGYRLTPRTRLHFNYTYSPLSNFDAHLFGTGLEVKF